MLVSEAYARQNVEKYAKSQGRQVSVTDKDTEFEIPDKLEEMGERRDTEKEPKVIITFHTTAGAIELERSCKAEKIPGRIIPRAQELSARCSLAWCSPEGEKGGWESC